jgi:hypothetical protein
LLVLTMPELWAAKLGKIGFAMRTIAELLAARTGHDPGDRAIRNPTRAVCRVALAVTTRSWTSPRNWTKPWPTRRMALVANWRLTAPRSTL